MRVKELISKLQCIDSRIKFVPGPGKQSGIYKFQPKHPDAHPNGLRWIGACPSPHMFFGKMQDFDWYDGPEYHRGWRKVINLLVSNGEIPAREATKNFSNKWRYPSKSYYPEVLGA